ncbi:hypothetical protein VTL71DRAFT_13179 [Oculimacula yallundae]|uniref:Ankyrin n=1 Tax=Oculimacula yallundae TaxID=86028 RepID=A0ABR4CJS0_9HELO
MTDSDPLGPLRLRDLIYNAIEQKNLQALERAFSHWNLAVSSLHVSDPDGHLEEFLFCAAELQLRDIANYLKDKGAKLRDWEVVDAFLEDESFEEEKWNLFLELGWDVNDNSARLRSLLSSLAVKGDHGDNVTRFQWLLAHGADPNQPFPPSSSVMNSIRARQVTQGTSLRRMPLDFASCGWSTQMVDMLLQYGASLTRANPLHAISCWPRDNIAEFQHMGEHLLELGVDINAFEFAGDPEYKERVVRAADYRYLGTPLHYAAHTGSAEQVQFLLQHGADRHKVNESHGFTALDLAFCRRSSMFPDGNTGQQAVLDLLTDGNKSLQVNSQLY